MHVYIHTGREEKTKKKEKETEGHEDEKRGVAVGGEGDRNGGLTTGAGVKGEGERREGEKGHREGVNSRDGGQK